MILIMPFGISASAYSVSFRSYFVFVSYTLENWWSLNERVLIFKNIVFLNCMEALGSWKLPGGLLCGMIRLSLPFSILKCQYLMSHLTLSKKESSACCLVGRLGTGMLLAFGFSTLRRKLDLKSHSSTHRFLFMLIFNPVLHSLSLSAMTDTPELGSLWFDFSSKNKSPVSFWENLGWEWYPANLNIDFQWIPLFFRFMADTYLPQVSCVSSKGILVGCEGHIVLQVVCDSYCKL